MGIICPYAHSSSTVQDQNALWLRCHMIWTGYCHIVGKGGGAPETPLSTPYGRSDPVMLQHTFHHIVIRSITLQGV